MKKRDQGINEFILYTQAKEIILKVILKKSWFETFNFFEYLMQRQKVRERKRERKRETNNLKKFHNVKE